MTHDRCPNCGAAAPEEYCPRCGQRQSDDPVPTLRRWIADVLDELLLVEARLPRTLRKLFWPPGELWAEWRRGRRASYVSPLRIYLLAAVPFFLLLSTLEYRSAGANFFHVVVEGVYLGVVPDELRPRLVPVEPMGPVPDSVRSDSALLAEWRAEYDRRQGIARANREAMDLRLREGVQRIMGLMPVLVGLIMVPGLALLLGFDPRRGERFASRLVASLHIHAVGYLIAIATWPLGIALPAGLLGATLYLGIAVYRTGDDSRAGAVLRALVTPLLYMIAFVLTYIGLVYGVTMIAPGWAFGL